MKPTPEVAQAFTSLRGDRNFQVVLHWVEQQLAKERERCVEHDGLLLYRAQGSAKTLAAFSKAYADAPALAQKHPTPSKGEHA